MTINEMSVTDFVQAVLGEEFSEEFKKVRPYQFMFESASHLVYFQNFDKPSDKLWYRITAKPRNLLRSSDKIAWICLTNPPDRNAYLLPVKDIEKQANVSKWTRPNLEINIGYLHHVWRELNWNLVKYLKNYRCSCLRL